MAVTLEKAKTFLSDKSGVGGANDAYIQDCIDEATELVTHFIGDEVVPEVAKDRAVLETVSELYHRRNAPNGIYQSEGFDQVVRLARDPMVGAYPILGRYMVIGL